MDFENNKDRILKAYNFPPSASEEDFKNYFSKVGEVESVKRYLDKKEPFYNFI